MNPSDSVKQLTFSAMLAALTFLGTFILRIPMPVLGYIHIGDAFVLLSGAILGPLYGGLAAATGAMLADLLGGYAAWMPGTFVIKFLMAAVVAAILRFPKGKKHILTLLAGAAGEIVMCIGYFLYDLFLLHLSGSGLAAAAALSAAGIPLNMIQGIAGIILAGLLMPVFQRLFAGTAAPSGN
jgi:uncharacterized membrane protein